MTVQGQKIVDLVMLDASYGGDAFGRLEDGRPVFVPFVFPGERVRVAIVVDHKDFCRGKLLEVLTPSPHRVQPRCPHFGSCGGCHYQHVPYDQQLALKQKIVQDQFKRIGKFTQVPVKEMQPSPLEWNYRNTMQFHLSPNGAPGFRDIHGAEVVEIRECHLPVEAIQQVWSNFEIETDLGIKRLFIRAGSDEEVLVGLEGEGDQVPDLALDLPLSVHFLGRDRDVLLAGDAYSLFNVKGVEFKVSPRSFFQVNLLQAEAMVNFVLANGNFHASSTVLDLYCGVGLFSAFLAPVVHDVVAVELSESACADFSDNLNAFDNVSLYIGAVEKVLPELQLRSDIVLVDPPRAGLARLVVDAITASEPQQIIYVSCDPATLARDCRRFTERGYKIDTVQPFDLFPQTYHIETICLLERI